VPVFNARHSEFAMINMLGDDSADGLSVLSISNSNPSASLVASSLLSSSLSAPMRAARAARLSPVKESASRAGPVFSSLDDSEPLFEMVTPPPRKPARRPSATAPDELFARQKVAPVPLRGVRSALSARLAAGTTTNPFSELYSAISGRGAAAAAAVIVFFPGSATPTRAMELSVRRDATVEEVLGFALWTYWQDKWEPPLDERQEDKLSAVGWVLRIAEEDGEVDEDFPRASIVWARWRRAGLIGTQHRIAWARYPSSALMRTPSSMLRPRRVRPARPSMIAR
jgi:hypothetical protein